MNLQGSKFNANIFFGGHSILRILVAACKKAICSVRVKSLLNLRCHAYFGLSSGKIMHNRYTQTQTKDLTIHFDGCFNSAFRCVNSEHSIIMSFNYFRRCIPKTKKRGPPHQKMHVKELLSYPERNHLPSSSIRRPHPTRCSGACICCLNFSFRTISCKIFEGIRTVTCFLITVCCRCVSMSTELSFDICGMFFWVSLGCFRAIFEIWYGRKLN